MPAEAKSKITLDIDSFVAALRKAEEEQEKYVSRSKKRLGSLKLPDFLKKGLGAAGKGADQLAAGVQGRLRGLAAPALGFGAGVAFTGAAIAEGVAGVFKLGGALTDLSDQTGISVRNLVILQKRFEDAGMEAEDAATAVGKMQKFLEEAVSDPGKQGALHKLNLSVLDLMAMKPERQLEAIGKAIGKMESPSARTAASMEIFGKSGAKLNRVFAGDLFDNVSAGLAKRAEMLERNAKLFDEISDKMMGPGGLAKTFYAGIAEGVAPALNSVIDALKKIDLVAMGKSFGDSLVEGAAALLKATDAVKKSGVIQNTVRLGKAVVDTGAPQGVLNFGGQILGGAAGLIERRGGTGQDWKKIGRGLFGRNRRPDGSIMDEEEVIKRNWDDYVERQRASGKPGYAKRPSAVSAGSSKRSVPATRPRQMSYDEYLNMLDDGRMSPPDDADVSVDKYYSERHQVGLASQFANLPPSKTSFASRLQPTLAAGLQPNMAKRLEACGLWEGDGNSKFGKSQTGLNVDTAEDFRQRRRKLMDDAKFANPNATPAQLNATVDAQMRQEKDQQKADAYRKNITDAANPKPAVGDKPKETPVSEALKDFTAILGSLIGGQTETLRQLIAQ